MALSASITCSPPISPACRIASTPCSAASASGRIKPCVSEMTPMRGSTPDTRFLRPDRVFVSILERLRGGFEGARIVTRLVPRNARPVHRLGGRIGAGHLFADIAELALSIGVVALLELSVAKSELQMAKEFFGREEALD